MNREIELLMNNERMNVMLSIIQRNFTDMYELAKRNYEIKSMDNESIEMTNYFEGQKEAYKYVVDFMKYMLKC